MTWLNIFDLVRHIFEFFFYLVTGPLVTIFAIKKLTQSRDPKAQLLELRKRLFELAQSHTSTFKENIVPLVGELDSQLKNENIKLVGKKDNI